MAMFRGFDHEIGIYGVFCGTNSVSLSDVLMQLSRLEIALTVISSL